MLNDDILELIEMNFHCYVEDFNKKIIAGNDGSSFAECLVAYANHIADMVDEIIFDSIKDYIAEPKDDLEE